MKTKQKTLFCKKIHYRICENLQINVIYGLVYENDGFVEIVTANNSYRINKDLVLSISTTEIPFRGRVPPDFLKKIEAVGGDVQ